MTILSLLLVVFAVVVLGWLAHFVIRRFFPAGLPQTIALCIVGIVLLLFFLSQTGLIGSFNGVLNHPL